MSLEVGLGRPVAPDGPGAEAVDDASAYWAFYEEVAARQLAAWAPEAPSLVLDLSGGRARFAAQLLATGHRVVHVVGGAPRVPVPPGTEDRFLPVQADARSLSWLGDASVDAVLAESRALSLCLAAEHTAADLHRVLRPGGRLLLVVDSLGHGLARLAEQGCWAELADVPNADVVLVPAGVDGQITRCFWPEELRELLTGVGLEVEWVRPRTVLTPAAVELAVERGGRPALQALVESERQRAEGWRGELPGLHLVVSARRPH